MSINLLEGMRCQPADVIDNWQREIHSESEDTIAVEAFAYTGLAFEEAFEPTEEDGIYQAKGSGYLFNVEFSESGQVSRFKLLDH